jgi:hypothetical protein
MIRVTVTLVFNDLTEADLRQQVHEYDALEFVTVEDVTDDPTTEANSNAIDPASVSPLDVVSLWAAGEGPTPDNVEGSWEEAPPL